MFGILDFFFLFISVRFEWLFRIELIADLSKLLLIELFKFSLGVLEFLLEVIEDSFFIIFLVKLFLGEFFLLVVGDDFFLIVDIGDLRFNLFFILLKFGVGRLGSFFLGFFLVVIFFLVVGGGGVLR